MNGTSLAPVASAPTAITRRGLLRAIGSAAAGLAIAPWVTDEVARGQSTTPVSAAGASAWDDLAGRLTGHLLRPDDSISI